MIKKLTAHGNSSALIIEKPILELLKISQNTLLEIQTDGQRLVITPILEEKPVSSIEATLERIKKRNEQTESLQSMAVEAV